MLIQYWFQQILSVEPPTHWTPLLTQKTGYTSLQLWLFYVQIYQHTYAVIIATVSNHDNVVVCKFNVVQMLWYGTCMSTIAVWVLVISVCIPPRGRIKGTARAIYSILPQLQGNMEYIAALGQYIYCPGADIVWRNRQYLRKGQEAQKILNVVQCWPRGKK